MNILDFFTGALGVCSILLLWFGSPLKLTLGKILFKRDFIMPIEFDDYLCIKHPILSKLLSCWICVSFWLSLVAGATFVIFLNAPPYTPIVTFLVYPSVCYIFKSFTKL